MDAICQSILAYTENYFYLIPEDDWWFVALKVLSYFTLVIPLMVFLIRYCIPDRSEQWFSLVFEATYSRKISEGQVETWFQDAFARMDNGERIECPTIQTAYLIHRMDLPLEEALRRVSIEPSFIPELELYERRLIAARSVNQ